MREGIIPDFPNNRAPQFDLSNGQLVVPAPPTNRTAIQEPFVREKEIDPSLYYPDDYVQELLQEWPVQRDLVIPVEQMPPAMLESMGAAWRQREANRQALDETSQQQ